MVSDPAVPSKYFSVFVEDVNNILPFNIHHKKNIIQEEEEFEAWESFIHILHKNFKSKIIRTGREHTDEGKLEKYLLQGGGYMEVILGQPLILKAHFLRKYRAETFKHALRKTVQHTAASRPELPLFIDNIIVEENTDDPLTMDKWMRMHHIYLQKSVVITIVALFIVAIFELIKVGLEIISLNYFGIHSTFTTIVGAIIIALLFEPLLHKTEEIVNKFLF